MQSAIFTSNRSSAGNTIQGDDGNNNYGQNNYSQL